MISVPLLTLLVCNFISIGVLPVLFFRRDKKYALCCLVMSAPFLVALASLLLNFLGFIELPPEADGRQFLVAQSGAVVLSVASMALIALTIGAHRALSAPWQRNYGVPAGVFTWGPYKRIRYHFYSACLLAIMAAVLALPHPLTLGCLFYSFIALSVNAGHEERRLAASEFGHEYRQYLSNSGRFFPRLMT